MSAQVFSLLFGLPFVWLLYHACARRPSIGLGGRATLWLVLAAGALLRLALLWDSGFHYDIGTYKAWALKLSDPAAPLAIYEPGYFADYPPLYMYVLATLGTLARTFGLETGSHFTALIKLPPLLADLGVTLLLWRHASRHLPATSAALLAGLYWLNPAVGFDSALWGQTDAILALLLLLAWAQWRGGRLWLASLILGAAVAFKPQGLVFAFVYGLAVLVSQPLMVTARQALVGLASFGAIIWPFAREQSLDWIFRLYFSTAETYDYLTVNAYNLWAALGLNWSRGRDVVPGLDLQLWAMLLAGAALLWIGLRTGRGLRAGPGTIERDNVLAWCFALAALLFYMLAPRMHERYVLGLLPMLVLLGVHRTDLRALLGLWSVTILANMGYVYHHYVTLDEVAPADTPVIRLIAAAQIAATALTLLACLAPGWLARQAGALQRAWRALPALRLAAPEQQRFGWPHAASLAMLGTLALAIGSLGLGTRHYPQTGLRLEEADILLHYAEPVRPARALIYAGHGQATLRLDAYGDTGWQPLIEDTEFRDFYKLHEIELPAGAPATRFRILLSQPDPALEISEFALLDGQGRPLIPERVRSRVANAQRLVDEPDTWFGGRGYRAAPYFDEIYHGRTGYEFHAGLSIYETTHPPLGKWLIAQGIAAFGMNPFGMRIAGVVGTALIVVVLGWGGWQLAGSLRALWLAGLLGLFEFSRFSIGRYATIDGFLMLFLLLCALCLWRSFCRPGLESPLAGWRLSPDLLLAGTFLGAAIATKWSALYFGVGVFAWFCYSLARGLRGDAPGAPPWPRLLGSAVLAFGLLPALIYYHSYLPFMRCLPDAPALWSLQGLREFWANQTYMYGYHSNLKDTHAFASAWYTWPLLLKPLWLYRDEAQSVLRSSITLLGNPLIWWTGLLAVAALVTRKLAWPGRDRLWLLGCIASLYLPWLGVARVSFIYHYYPVVPFLILLLAVSLARWPFEGRRLRRLPEMFVAAAGLLFAWFFPAISGLPVSPAWSASLRWLPGWWML